MCTQVTFWEQALPENLRIPWPTYQTSLSSRLRLSLSTTFPPLISSAHLILFLIEEPMQRYPSLNSQCCVGYPSSEWATPMLCRLSQCCVGYLSTMWAIPVLCMTAIPLSLFFMLWKSVMWRTAKLKPESLLFVQSSEDMQMLIH